MLLLLLYLINLYIRPQDWMKVFYAWPVDYLIIIPALIYGIIIMQSEKKPLVSIPQNKLLIALLIIIFLSNAVHGNFTFGIDEFVLFLKKVCVFIIVLLTANSIKKLKNTMFITVLLCAVIAVQAIIQFFSGGLGLAGQDFYHSGEGVRTTWVGLWNGANSTALLLNVSVPFALEFTFGPYPVYWRLVNLILTGLLIGGVYTTNSRGGFVTLLAILALYPLFKTKKKTIAIVIGVILAVGTLFAFAPSRLDQMSTQEESAHIRTRLWGNAMDMFKENKLLGVGKGKFIEENARQMAGHSNFMQNLAEIGGLGIFVWVALIYFSFRSLYYVLKLKPLPESKEEKLQSLARALFISLIGFNICTLFVTMDMELFYLLLGLSAATVNIMNRQVCPISIRFKLADVGAICMIIVGLLGFYHIYTR